LGIIYSKGDKMTKWWVYSKELVYYTTLVEADTEEEAIRKIADAEVLVGEPDDGQDFEVTGAEKYEDVLGNSI
jgi:hypothetical protein